MEYKDVSIMVLRGQRNKAIKFLNVRGLFKISHGNRYGILFCTSVFRARLWTLFTTLCLMSRDTLFLLSSVFAHALARISLCALYGSDWYARRGTILGEPRTSTIFWTVRKIFCGHTGGALESLADWLWIARCQSSGKRRRERRLVYLDLREATKP